MMRRPLFLSVFLAECGDRTQIAMRLFAADQRQSRGGVFLASAGALVFSSLPAHVRVLPMQGLRSSLTALCLACCLLMPMGAGDLVFCIGADGHVAFEPARNSRCPSWGFLPNPPKRYSSAMHTRITI
jgi:hypothetical protein